MIRLSKLLAEGLDSVSQSKKLSKKDKLRAKHLAEQIFLAEQQSGISDVIVGAGFASASKTFTSTAKAVEAIKAAGVAVNGTVTETQCIKKAAGSDGPYVPAAKSINQQHYLKIGDKIIQGTQSSLMRITPLDLQSQEIEAAGNGIFALGRAYVTRSAMKGQGMKFANVALIIELNAPKPVGGAWFKIDTGFQNAIQSWAFAASATLVAIGAVKPNNFNNQSNAIGNNLKAKGTGGSLLNRRAMPQISTSGFDQSKYESVSPVPDTSAFQDAGKNFTTQSEAAASMKKFTDTYFKTWITSLGERFKKWCEDQAVAYGMSANAAFPIKTYIDSWVASQKQDTYLASTNEAVKEYFFTPQKVAGGTRTTVGAMSGGAAGGGKEGEISPIKPK
jgi:hypothetical protein